MFEPASGLFAEWLAGVVETVNYEICAKAYGKAGGAYADMAEECRRETAALFVMLEAQAPL